MFWETATGLALREEEREEGREEGLQEGLQKGQRELLLDLLETRFGSLPENWVQQVEQATAREFRFWTKNFVRASSLDEVFALSGD